MGIFGLGLPEVAVIAGVAVVLFGPSKLPELGKTLGKTVRSLQDAAQVRKRVSRLTERTTEFQSSMRGAMHPSPFIFFARSTGKGGRETVM